MKTTKLCEICGEEKPLSEFSKSYRNRCRACVAEQTRDKRQTKAITAACSERIDTVDPAELRLVEAAIPALINCTDEDFSDYACNEIADRAVRIARAALSRLRKNDNLA